MRVTRRSLLRPWRMFVARPPGAVRPPGALDEERFLSRCTGCNDCLEACPEGAIRPFGPFGTPVIIPRDRPCAVCTDLPCTKVCTPGALRPVRVEEVRMGLARVEAARCWSALGQPCDYCVTACPIRAISLDGLPRVDATRCNGCGACEQICTATPAAITVA